MNNEQSTINNEPSISPVPWDKSTREISKPQDNEATYNQVLLQLMQRVGLSSFKALSRKSGVPEKQLRRLRRGEISRLRWEIFCQLSETLEVPVTELLATFAGVGYPNSEISQEYQRLASQMTSQRQELMLEFQQSSLAVLESWLRQWPIAEDKARENPQLPAVNLLPLVRPVQQLVEQWGVESIAPIGSEVPYDPQWHQLAEGTAETGDLVKVVGPGYRHGDKLLYRAEVTPL
ncbi:MAG: helix-turn-helix domain-containing protein [Hormoscilla sp. GM7CHS1pb]|nr:helix-turn-helix domain-containing protein [Hormoscilla sp. GM7CHS1pb]